MKRLFVLMFVFAFISINAQTTVVLLSDTLGNSGSATGYLDLDQFAPRSVDSIDFLVYASGEIDIDSVSVSGGIRVNATYLGSQVRVDEFEVITAILGTSTINLADGVEGVVEGFPLTVSGQTINGYNALKFIVHGAAAGCDNTDTGQKVVVIARVFTSE